MRFLPILFGLMIVPLLSCAQQKGEYNTDKNNVLIGGYDVVSYHQTQVLKGDEQFQAEFDGVILYFSSEKNKNEYEKAPENYMPKYGGWCAYAVGDNGEKVSVNPKTYKIIDGELYLFYNKNATNTLKLWNKNEDELKKKADENWPLIK